MVDDGNTTGRGALDSRNERGRFSGITGRTVIAGTYLLDPVRMRGLGAGDIKLLCVVGCLNGSRDIIYCICISFLLAAGFSFGRLLNRSSFGQVCEAVFNIFNELQHLEKLFLMTEEKCPDIKFIFLHLSFWDMQQFWG